MNNTLTYDKGVGMLSFKYVDGAVNTGYVKVVNGKRTTIWRIPDPEQLCLFDLTEYDLHGFNGERTWLAHDQYILNS